MPMCDFFCQACNLEFEKFSRKRDITEIECPSCEALSPRQISGFGFEFESGKTPGNSGVDSVDNSIDKLVGRDAKNRWEKEKARAAYKRQVQRDHGGVGKVPLARNEETGEYVPVPEDKLPRIQELHKEYDSAYKEHKAERESKGVGKFADNDPYTRPASKED